MRTVSIAGAFAGSLLVTTALHAADVGRGADLVLLKKKLGDDG